MGYFVILALSWFDTLIAKNKGIFITIIAFAWMAYLGGAASPISTLDYATYQYYYSLLVNGQQNRLEWLYNYFSNIAILHNLEYSDFRLWLISVTFVILFLAVVRLTAKPIIFAAFFMIFPFFNEVTQVRSFVAYTLVLFGLSFLNSLTIKKIIVFELFVWLGMGFHSSAAIFSLVPFVQFLIKKNGVFKVSCLSIIFTSTMSLLLFITSRSKIIVGLIGSALHIVAGSSISDTFVNLMNNSGGGVLFFLTIFLSYSLFQWYLVQTGARIFKSASEELVPFSQYALLIVGELLLPLLLVSDQLQRFQRFGIETGILIVGTIFFQMRNKKDNGAFIFFSIMLIFILFFAYVFYGVMNPSDDFPKSIPYIAHLMSEN